MTLSLPRQRYHRPAKCKQRVKRESPVGAAGLVAVAREVVARVEVEWAHVGSGEGGGGEGGEG